MRMARYQPQAAICRKESTSRSHANTWFELATVGDATLQISFENVQIGPTNRRRSDANNGIALILDGRARFVLGDDP